MISKSLKFNKYDKKHSIKKNTAKKNTNKTYKKNKYNKSKKKKEDLLLILKLNIIMVLKNRKNYGNNMKT